MQHSTASDTNPPPAETDGQLERFIVAFNQYEAQADLFSRCKDAQGFPWWDMVRYSPQLEIAFEKDFFSKQVDAPSSRWLRPFRLLRQIGRLIRLLFGVAGLKHKKLDTLYLSTRNLEPAQKRMQAESERILFVNQNGQAEPPHAALSKLAVDFLVRLLAPLCSVPPEVKNALRMIATELEERFASQADLYALMLSEYKQARAGFRVWQIILAQLPSLKRVLVVNDDQVQPLIALAREKGLETIEVQHGYMGRAHFSYSYPPLPFNLPTLPDKIWVERDTGDIVVPVPTVTLEQTQQPNRNIHRDIDVLIGGVPGRNEELRTIVSALVDTGRKLAVKLHPTQTVESTGLRQEFSTDRVTIYPGGDHFMSLVERSHIFIPVSATSTTAFEAVEAGAKLIVIHHNGHKITSMCDPIAAVETNAADELRDAVERILKQREI